MLGRRGRGPPARHTLRPVQLDLPLSRPDIRAQLVEEIAAFVLLNRYQLPTRLGELREVCCCIEDCYVAAAKEEAGS